VDFDLFKFTTKGDNLFYYGEYATIKSKAGLKIIECILTI